MIGLSRIEPGILPNLGHDRFREHLGLVKLGDIRFGYPDLFWIRRENLRPILCPLVRILLVELCRVRRDREKYLQQAAIGDDVRIVGDPHDSAWPVVPLLTTSYCAVPAAPPWSPETALTTPRTCWNTPWTPQKHPPAEGERLRTDQVASHPPAGRAGFGRDRRPWRLRHRRDPAGKCPKSSRRDGRRAQQRLGVPHYVLLRFHTALKVSATPFMQ